MEQANFYNFAGRHAVITGGAAGIGLAIAQRLAAGGASLTLWDRDAALMQAAKAALGASARQVRNGPRRLMAMTWSQSATG